MLNRAPEVVTYDQQIVNRNTYGHEHDTQVTYLFVFFQAKHGTAGEQVRQQTQHVHVYYNLLSVH